MDKWDTLASAVFESVKQENKEATGTSVLCFLCEIARTFEQIGADLDRIATALERIPYGDGK